MRPEVTDEMLMLDYRAGNAESFAALFARHSGGLFRYFLRQCRDHGLAEELAQDVWMRVIKAAHGYEVSAKFSTYLYRIAHNRLIDHVRRCEARPEHSYDEAAEEIEALPAAEFAMPDRLHERRQLAERLVEALEALPAEQREAFLLHEEAGMTLEEIASVTGAGRETIKSRLRYAINKLRRSLAGASTYDEFR